MTCLLKEVPRWTADWTQGTAASQSVGEFKAAVAVSTACPVQSLPGKPLTSGFHQYALAAV